jgi:hypothetical protein
MEDGRHTAVILAKNTKDTCHKDYESSDRKARVINNDDDSESSEDRLENYIHQLDKRNKQDYGQLQKHHGETNKEKKIRWSKSLSSSKIYFRSSIEHEFSDDSEWKILSPALTVKITGEERCGTVRSKFSETWWKNL